MAVSEFRDRRSVTKLVAPLLEESARLGFLGVAPIDDHIDHALRLAGVVRDLVSDGDRVLDLGSGGGLPGLVLAVAMPTLQVTLCDAQHRRCEFLRGAVIALEPTEVAVLEGRAEILGRLDAHDGTYSLVVARSFGAPAVVAECATRFLVSDGALVVSEPPYLDEERWPAEGLAELGFSLEHQSMDPVPVAVLRKTGPTPDRYPRRDGVPTRRPLWS